MKVLILNGSPRGPKSNTYRMALAFTDGIRAELGVSADIRTIDVYTAHIEDCRGCFCCWTSTPGKCVVDDDAEYILSEITAADVVVWSFPLYYFGMPSKLKALLDRHLPTLLPFIAERSDGSYVHAFRGADRPAGSVMPAAKNVLISGGGLGKERNNFEALLKQFDILCDGSYTKIICPQSEAFSHVDVTDYLASIKEAGREYAHSGYLSEKTERSVNSSLYPPEAYVKMADASWDIEDTAWGRSPEAKAQSAAERFTRQMAATYNPGAFDGVERVFEIYYTDVGTGYQLVMGKDQCEVRLSDFAPYTTRVETPLTVWQDISKGVCSGEQAMMEGRYKTLGDLRLLISWNRYFGLESAKAMSSDASTGKAPKKTNLTLLIIPWFVIWLLLSINAVVGGIAGICVAACLPFARLKWTLTVYDDISCLCVSLFSLLALLGFSTQIILPLSYLSFGIMWLVSCLTPIPLTAHYSKNSYNGDDALKNPLFIKTNLILTLCWAVLYLITPIWTYFIMGSSMPWLTALVNTVCPAFLGIFTNWFQKWYPAKIARG